jgi:hypothetical protein
LSAEAAAGRLHDAAERLEAIAAELDDPATADARAVELAREAAQIAAEAGGAVAEAAREAAETGGEQG